MAQDYDVSLKLLFHHSRGLVAQRLFGGPVIEWVDIEQPKVTNIRVDLLARLADGSLRHVELQKKRKGRVGAAPNREEPLAMPRRSESVLRVFLKRMRPTSDGAKPNTTSVSTVC